MGTQNSATYEELGMAAFYAGRKMVWELDNNIKSWFHHSPPGCIEQVIQPLSLFCKMEIVIATSQVCYED